MAVTAPVLQPVDASAAARVWTGGASTLDNEVILQIDDADRFNAIIFGQTAGAVDVYGSLDGVNFLSTAISLNDLGSTTGAFANGVATSAANRAYKVPGTFKALRFLQDGATDVADFAAVARVTR